MRFHSRARSPPGASCSTWQLTHSGLLPLPCVDCSPHQSARSGPCPTAFTLTGLWAVALDPCMAICVLSPWVGGWYLHACCKPDPGLFIHTLLTFFLFLGQVFLVGKFSALPNLCRALMCLNGSERCPVLSPQTCVHLHPAPYPVTSVRPRWLLLVLFGSYSR